MSDSTGSSPRVLVLVKDLFFSVKIGNELRGSGYEPIFVRNLTAFVSNLAEQPPVLALLDIGAGLDWDQVRELIAHPETPDVPMIAFGPHKDVDGLRAAKAAGVTRVVSNSQMHGTLPELVDRYARR